MELTAALIALLVVTIWRAVRRQRTNPFGSLPDVGDAPPGSTPLASWRSSDDGLWTYYLDLPAADRAASTGRPPIGDA
jgi:hypothetical protein